MAPPRPARRAGMATRCLVVAALAACCAAPTPGAVLRGGLVFDVAAYGAVGDNATDNTAAFRAASDALRGAGGGTLLVGAGIFVTGAFNLSSGTTLAVRGTILGAADAALFPVIAPLPSYGVSRDKGFAARHQALIMATGAREVRITGGGTIDGGGAFWWDLGAAQTAGRPRLIELYNCTDVEVGNVTLRDAGFWTLHAVYSRRVWLHDLVIRAPPDSPNTDGIDPDSSTDVLIERCDISCGDDHIAIKSGLDTAGRTVGLPCRNVTVRDSVFRAGRGLSIGSEVSGGVSDVLFEDLRLVGPSHHALHIKTSGARGGYVCNITFRNCTVGAITADALLSITSDYDGPPEADAALTDISRLRFEHLRADRDVDHSGNAAGVFGCFPDRPCHDVAVFDVDLRPAAGWTCVGVEQTAVRAVEPPGLAQCFASAPTGS
ncbi:pectin lyase fold/virulence factor [Pelagophyceae sp. CCMP2097]|nr:pectin lyase fold/virulence factor [Pelagophyceae sp. CCMP2097]